MSYIMIVINLLGTLITPILEDIVTLVHRYRKNKRTGNYMQLLPTILKKKNIHHEII